MSAEGAIWCPACNRTHGPFNEPLTDREFLTWLSERLVHVYDESPNVDFVHRLRRIADRQTDTSARVSPEMVRLSAEAMANRRAAGAAAMPLDGDS